MGKARSETIANLSPAYPPACMKRFLKPIAPLPLRVVLIAPFLLQMAIAVSIVGYLSFRTGQRAVHSLASQLRSELTARIQQRLHYSVASPHLVNSLNATALSNGTLDLANIKGGSQLIQQLKNTPLTNSLYCGNERGDFFGATRRSGTSRFDRRTLKMMVSNQGTGGAYHLYDVDHQGNLTHLLENLAPYDPRQRPWYIAGRQAGQPTWSPIYLDFSSGLPTITASQPVYQNNALLGVCGTDIVLSEELRTFLHSLDIGKSGEAFIIERSGALISSSTDDDYTVMDGDPRQRAHRARRLQATESQDPLVRATATHLLSHFGNFSDIRESQQLDFAIEGKRQFIQVAPFQDGQGLDWLVVLVVPEVDFMGQIQANTRNTVLLCLLALAIATGVGIVTARMLMGPILRLIQATEAIAGGQLEQNVTTQGIHELLRLANSFNSMTAQLKESFESLESQRNSFARFVPTEYLEFLRRDSLVNVALGEHVSTDMAMLFSDIRSFTTLLEQMTPQESFTFINGYLEQVSPEIRNYGGFIVKYLGDGIMAAFPQGSRDAVAAAIAQQERVRHYNTIIPQTFPIQIGIGIHFGRIMVGIVGETGRMQGDAFSDAVNLAARLEGVTKFYGVAVLISEAVLKNLGDHPYGVRFLDRVMVKGRGEAIAIYEVLDADPDKERKLATQGDFMAGIAAYQQGDIATAQAAFTAVLTQNPTDKTASLYLERLAWLERNGFPSPWQGIWQFTDK